MSKAYHQGFMHENSQQAFTSPWGLYEWLRIPFGLSAVPPVFQQFINECFSGLRDSICTPYLDYILRYGKNFDEHLENLRTVFHRLWQFGVKLKVKKFCLNQKWNIFKKLSAKQGLRMIQWTQKLSENYVNPLRLWETYENSLDFWVIIDNLLKSFTIWKCFQKKSSIKKNERRNFLKWTNIMVKGPLKHHFRVYRKTKPHQNYVVSWFYKTICCSLRCEWKRFGSIVISKNRRHFWHESGLLLKNFLIICTIQTNLQFILITILCCT